jgi:hypothetical protein
MTRLMNTIESKIGILSVTNEVNIQLRRPKNSYR